MPSMPDMHVKVHVYPVVHWARQLPRRLVPPAHLVMLLLQLMGAFAILYGISWFSIPVALIIGGVGAIVAIELQAHEKKLTPEDITLIQTRIKAYLASGEDPFGQPGVPMTPFWVAWAAQLRRQQ